MMSATRPAALKNYWTDAAVMGSHVLCVVATKRIKRSAVADADISAAVLPRFCENDRPKTDKFKRYSQVSETIS
jgi:hypothetical protein